MSYATARADVAELAIELLNDGEDKDDLYSIFLLISTILLTCNDAMVRRELVKAQDDGNRT